MPNALAIVNEMIGEPWLPGWSCAESEEDDLKDEIGRLTTPVPDAKGNLEFRHRGSTLSVECSHTGYFLPIVQPIYYGSDAEANDDTGEILYTDALLSLRHRGNLTVKVVLDAYVKWGTMKVYHSENDIKGHPRHIISNLELVRNLTSVSGKVATIHL